MPNLPPTLVLHGRASFAYVTDVSVAVIDVPTWTDALIDEYLVELTTLGERAVARASLTRFLGEVPGAAHRRRIADWLEREGLTGSLRSCVLTDSALMRGAMTAYGWLTNTEVRAFLPRELDTACRFLCEGCVATPEQVRRAVLGCHAKLGIAL